MRNTTLYKNTPKTFRRSSCKLITGQGSNLQNVEKSMRAIYESDGFSKDLENKCSYWLQTGDISVFTEEELFKLRVLVQRDQAGAEALIVAYECYDGDYRQLFIHGVKPHVYVALKLFKDVWRSKMKQHGGLIEDLDLDKICDTPIRDLKLNPFWKDLDLLIKDSDNWSLEERYYYLAKQTVHSANYDIQWATFIMNILEKSGGKIVVSREQGEYFLNVYRDLFPEIPERNRRIEQQAEMTRILYNMFGFPYQITDYNILRTRVKELYAWSAQSTVGEITRIAFTKMQEYIESEKQPIDILADTHDSYLCQCPLNLVKLTIEKTKEYMNQKLISPVDGVEFSMKSECQVGFNWAPFNKETNKLGLRELSWI